MRKYGWDKPDLPDFRDFPFAAFPAVAKLPQVVYLICPPVQDQGDYGSCVFNATTTAMEAVMIDENKPLEMLSRMFAYDDYRLKNGIALSNDSGASIREAIKLIAKDGICHESLYPYTPANFERKPPPEAYQEALTHRILSYYRLISLSDMLNCMASGYGFVCGISVYASFETPVAGVIPMPDRSEEFLGGHALWFYGYDRHKRVFHGQNSWGESWGKGGRFTIPFDYLTNPGLASDFWTVRH
jgi:C1A family cysteine protease